MTIETNSGDGLNLGSGADEQELLEYYEEHGIDAFGYDIRGWPNAVKHRVVFERALEDLTFEGISEITDLKVQVLEETAIWHELITHEEADHVSEGRARRIRSAVYGPWRPDPHPSKIARHSGNYSHTPW